MKRNYIFSKNKKNLDKVINSFNNNGFCVIEDVIPKRKIESVKKEVLVAKRKNSENFNLYKKLLSQNLSDKDLLNHKKLKIRSQRIISKPPKLVNEIIWMPEYAKYLCDNFITSFVKRILDEHIKIIQLHTKISPQLDKIDNKVKLGKDPFGLPRILKGNENTREWHTDWPHDPWAYGGGVKGENIGCLKQPFPNLTMCIVMVWYLTDVDNEKGGTFCLPKSHKSNKNPRGIRDNIPLTMPLKDEIQIKAKAGSVLIQDSRLWHSVATQLNNKSGDRVAVVNRWAPWWLAADDYAPDSRFNVVCKPINKFEFKNLPKKLQPLMQHLCADLKEYLNEKLIKRSATSVKSKKKYYLQINR